MKTMANIQTIYETYLRIIKDEDIESPLLGLKSFIPKTNYWFNTTDLKKVLGIKHFTSIYPYIGHRHRDFKSYFQTSKFVSYIELSDLLEILNSNRFKITIGGKNWLLNNIIPNLAEFEYFTANEIYKKQLNGVWPS